MHFYVWWSYHILKSQQCDFSIEYEEISYSLPLTISFLSLNNEETLGSLTHVILLVENYIGLSFYVVNEQDQVDK